jgi:hypothetical protein
MVHEIVQEKLTDDVEHIHHISIHVVSVGILFGVIFVIMAKKMVVVASNVQRGHLPVHALSLCARSSRWRRSRA